MERWQHLLREWYAEAVALVAARIPGFKGFRFEEIRWEVSRRASRKAGVCWSQQKRIWLHGAMTPEQAKSTFIHELAHLFAYWFEDPSASPWERRYNHGPVFRKWARMMGDSGDRCHNYTEVMESRRGDWAHCPSCKSEFKKVWRYGNPTTYRCRRCQVHIVAGRVPGKVAAAPPPPPPPPRKVEVKPAAKKPEQVFATILAGKADDLETLKEALRALHEAGLASGPLGRKVRRQLRALGHRGGLGD